MADHRVERARERYGLELTRDDVAHLETLISKHNRIQQQDPLRAVHAIVYRGVVLICAVACREPPAIATFLPADYATAGYRSRSASVIHGKGYRHPDTLRKDSRKGRRSTAPRQRDWSAELETDDD